MYLDGDAKLVRQYSFAIHSAQLYNFGHGETEHTTRVKGESVSGKCQLCFHCCVRSGDVNKGNNVIREIFL